VVDASASPSPVMGEELAPPHAATSAMTREEAKTAEAECEKRMVAVTQPPCRHERP